jgi:hypothetical protein
MEGVFYTTNRDQNLRDIQRLINGKESLRICSLTKKADEPLMWGHYADGNRGIVVGLKLNKNVNTYQIIYDGNMVYDLGVNLVDLFIHKNPDWSYEQEIRFFSKKQYQTVEIVEIIFGVRTDVKLKKLIMKLIRLVNPNIIFKQQNRNFENIEIINQNN